jgi:hypothetical protein
LTSTNQQFFAPIAGLLKRLRDQRWPSELACEAPGSRRANLPLIQKQRNQSFHWETMADKAPSQRHMTEFMNSNLMRQKGAVDLTGINKLARITSDISSPLVQLGTPKLCR